MSESIAFLSLIKYALTVTMKISLPFLITSVLVGLAIGIFQTVTHIQDASVSFVPKIFVMIVLVFLFGKIVLEQLIILFSDFFYLIPKTCRM
ncbi:MAG: flagellar biosynthetic protein FliQ [Elusimicrobiales bacterium]|nr:flagellar biosynthetic protein FliQ [Elusimicrobiales bacterium]